MGLTCGVFSSRWLSLVCQSFQQKPPGNVSCRMPKRKSDRSIVRKSGNCSFVEVFIELPLHDAEKEVDMTGWSEGIRLFYCCIPVLPSKGKCFECENHINYPQLCPCRYSTPHNFIQIYIYTLFLCTYTVIYVIPHSMTNIFFWWNHQLKNHGQHHHLHLWRKFLCPLGQSVLGGFRQPGASSGKDGSHSSRRYAGARRGGEAFERRLQFFSQKPLDWGMVFCWRCSIITLICMIQKTDRLACFLAFAWLQKVLVFFHPGATPTGLACLFVISAIFCLGSRLQDATPGFPCIGHTWSALFRWELKKNTRWIILVGYVVFSCTVDEFFMNLGTLKKMIGFHGPLPTKLLLLKEFMVEINTQLFKCHKPIPVKFQVTWSGWCLRNPVVARFFFAGAEVLQCTWSWETALRFVRRRQQKNPQYRWCDIPPTVCFLRSEQKS